jgi:exodeoxyribonuclease VII large subunit
LACAERARQARDALADAVIGGTQRARQRLDHARSRLRLLSPAAQVERGFLRLDDCANRLAAALRASVQRRRLELTAARTRLDRVAPELRLPLAQHRLLALAKRLQAASPASVLNRGFVILRDERGRPVMRRAEVRAGQRLGAEFADGTAPLRAD